MSSVRYSLKSLLQSGSLRWNFVGNMTGRLWLGVMSLVSVPVFVHLLGANAFGIVSLAATFQSVLALLDFGLAGTANREVAMARAECANTYDAEHKSRSLSSRQK